MSTNLPDAGKLGKSQTKNRRRVACIDPHGRRHISMSAAAIAWQRSPTSVFWDVKLSRNGWRAAGPSDLPPTSDR